MAQGVQEVYALTASTSFTGQAFTNPNRIKNLLQENKGSIPVYVNYTTTSGATASDFRLDPGASVSLTARGFFSGFSVLCSTSSGTGGTSVVHTMGIGI